MKVADLMVPDVKTVSEHTTIADAVVILAESHVHALPVVDTRGRLLGVVSTTDVLEAAAEAASPEEREDLFQRTPVRDIMTPKPRTVRPDDDVKDAAQHMLYLDVHRLFVEVDGALVGVLSQSDIVRAVATAKI